jgi:hypothetical protein
LWFYYNIGEGPGILAPPRDQADPVRVLREKLRDTGNEQDEKLAKSLSPKQRFYAVVIDRDDKEQTPKFWGFGRQVYERLLETLLNPKWGNFMDVSTGLDLEVKSEKKKGKKWPETTVTFDRLSSPLSESQEEVEEILSKIKPIEEVFKPSTEEEIQKRLDEWLNKSDGTDSEAETEAQSAETTRGNIETDAEADLDVEAELDRAIAESEKASVEA